MIDFKSRPYMAKLMHLFEDYVEIMCLMEDIKTVIDNGEDVSLKTMSTQFNLTANDLQVSLESTHQYKQKQLEELEKQVRVLIYGPENTEFNGN